MGTAGRLVLAGAGYLVGGPVGFAVGSLLGAFLFPKKKDYGPDKIANLQFQTTAKGTPLQVFYGKQRLAGNIMWIGDFKQHRSGGGKGSKGGTGGKSQQSAVTYTVSFAVGICEGTIDRVHRIWANKTLVDLERYASQITIYKGLADQAVDPTINAIQGGAQASQPQWFETFIANGSGVTYVARRTPIVSATDALYYFVEGGDTITDRRVNLTRVSSAPTQDQYTIDLTTGLVTLGGTYTDRTMTLEYRQDASATVSDTPRYPYVSFAVFKDWDLGGTTSIPNMTFEASRRIPPESMPGRFLGVITGSGTYERRNPDTGALVDTITMEEANGASWCGDEWPFWAVQVSGSIKVMNANTGKIIGTYTPQGVDQALGQAGSGQPLSFNAHGLGLAEVDSFVTGNKKMAQLSFTFTDDFKGFTRFDIDWFARGPNESEPHTIAVDAKFVYMMTRHSANPGLYIYSRKPGINGESVLIKTFKVNRAEISTSTTDEILTEGIGSMYVEGSLLYVYWLRATQPAGDNGEIRIYDLGGGSATAPSEIGAFSPNATLLPNYRVTGADPVAFNKFPLVKVITGVKRHPLPGVFNENTVGMCASGRMVYVDRQNDAETLMRAINIDSGAIIWTATHVVRSDGDSRAMHIITPGSHYNNAVGDVNPAWAIYDYLTHDRYGGGADPATVDETTFGDAANWLTHKNILMSPVFRDRKKIHAALESLLVLIDCFLVYTEGKWKMKVRRAEGTSATPKAITTAAYTKDDDVSVTREGSGQLVNRAVVHFVNRANDYTQESVEAKEDWLVGRREGREMEVGSEAVTSADLARRIAYRLMWTHSFKRLVGRLPIGPQDGEIEPGDPITWTDADLGFSNKPLRVMAIGESPSGKAAVEVMEENSVITDWYDTSIPSSDYAFLPLPQPHEPAGHTRLDVLELDPIPVNGNPSIVLIVSGRDRAWRGARLYASDDNVTYTRISEVGTGSVWGVTKTSLASTQSQFQDDVNTVDVEVLTPTTTLLTVTDSQWRAGVNRILIDSEIIYFRTATLVSGQRYTLSGLLRGMELSTAASHSAEAGFLVMNQYAVVLTPVRGTIPRVGLQPVRSMPIDWALVGRTIYFKATSINIMGEEQPIADVRPVSISYAGTGGTPGRVNNLRIEQRLSPSTPTGTDLFDRADAQVLGSPWVETEEDPGGGRTFIDISSNFVRMGTATGVSAGGFAYWDVDFGADQYSEMIWNVVASGDANTKRSGPAVRIQSGGTVTSFTAYVALYDLLNGRVELRRFNGQGVRSGGTLLGQFTVTLVDLDILRLEVIGTSLIVKRNGVVIITATDGSITAAGRPGFHGDFGSNTVHRWYSWGGGSLGSVSTIFKMGTGDVTPDPVTVRTASNRDITLIWNYTDPIIGEDSEFENAGSPAKWSGFSHYRVIVKEGANVLRTIDNIAVEEFTYTDAMNLADHSSVYDTTVTFEVYAVGRDGGVSAVQSHAVTVIAQA